MIKSLLKAFKSALDAFLGPSVVIPLTDYEVVSKARCLLSTRYHVLVKVERQRCRVIFKRPYRCDRDQINYRVRSEIVGDGPEWIKKAASIEEVYPGLRWDLLDTAFSKNLFLEKVMTGINEIFLLRMMDQIVERSKEHRANGKSKNEK